MAFPRLIGCGVGGGNWVDYEDEIRQLALRNLQVKVCIYKLPPRPAAGEIFRVMVSPSGRAKCSVRGGGCGLKIEKCSIRLGKAAAFRGNETTQWLHPKCANLWRLSVAALKGVDGWDEMSKRAQAELHTLRAFRC